MKSLVVAHCKTKQLQNPKKNGAAFNLENVSYRRGFKSIRGGSRAAATSKMERFVIIVNGWKPLTIITKRSILDVAAVLDPPLSMIFNS